MTPLPTSLLDGQVGHTRQGPKRHVLRYPLLSILSDIDGDADHMRELTGWSPLDHGDGEANLRPWIIKRVRETGFIGELGRIQVLTAPRQLGLVFNPLSVFFAHDLNQQLRAVIFEVSNFHAGRGIYAFPVTDPVENTLRFDCAKDFFVSPFNPVAGDYAFKLERNAQTYRLSIRYERDGKLIMTAVHSARLQPFDRKVLRRRRLTLALNTPRTVAAILFEALKLRLKGLKLHSPRRGSIDTQPWRS